jgi:hypothetical protein
LIVNADRFGQANSALPEGWQQVQSVRRRSSTDAETLLIYKRTGA